MAAQAKTKRKKDRPRKPGWWASMDVERRHRIVRRSLGALAVAVIATAGSAALARLDTHVKRALLSARPAATLAFIDLPDAITAMARSELEDSLASLTDGAWTDDRLCRVMAGRLAGVGWVAKVNYVRRTSDACFTVSCQYRLPAAMVAHEREYHLVDAEGVRLPGVYRYDSAYCLIQGVAEPPPRPGTVWPGLDIRAGLAAWSLVRKEPFAGQVTAILVENVSGRMAPGQSHVELATDQVGGRIRWGSAPGAELEENTVAQKLALLRENHRRTGRLDAGHLVIDISTFADRFTIPG